MMDMDLISRQVAIDQTKGKLDYTDLVFDTATESEIVYMLRSLPSVPAVPLGPLCEWLAGYADPPKYAMKIIPKSGEYLINARAKAWEHHFRTMMECGLMEEGQHENR